MAITPDSSKELAAAVAEVYFAAEIKLFKALKTRLKGSESYEDFRQKYNQIRLLRKDINKIILKLDQYSETEVSRILKKAYFNGANMADIDILENAKTLEITAAFNRVDEGKIEALAKAIIGQLQEGHPQILRYADDVFRKVISEGVRDMAAGSITRQRAVQEALNRFADQGVAAFIDKSGRRWSLSAYSEMAVRSGLVQANLSGTMDRMSELNQDLVIVSEHPEECELCRPFENKVLSLSGRSNKFLSLQQAREKGLFHPNCSHSVSIYLEGYTDIPKKLTAEERKAAQEKFEQRQRLNQMLRNKEKWQRREAAALTEEEAVKASSKIKLWDMEIRQFKKKNDL